MLRYEFEERIEKLQRPQLQAFLMTPHSDFPSWRTKDFYGESGRKANCLLAVLAQFDKEPNGAAQKLRAILNPQDASGEAVRETNERVTDALTTVLEAKEALSDAPAKLEALADKVVGALLQNAVTQIDDVKAGAREAVIAEISSALNAVQDVATLKVEIAEVAAKHAEQLIAARLDTFRQIEVKSPRGRVRLNKSVITPPEFERVCELVDSDVPVLLVGPSGSGKTFLTSLVAQALKLDHSVVSCSMGMSEAQLTGRLLPTGRAGAFEFHDGVYVQRYEQGGLFTADELDAADPNVLVMLNNSISSEEGFVVDARFDLPFVERHEDFRIVACANTYGLGADQLYVGRSQLDASTLDRFRAGIVHVDYSEAVERSLVKDVPWVYDYCLGIRRRIEKCKLLRIMSTRTIKHFGKMARVNNWTITDFDKTFFADWTPDEKRRFDLA